jgi:NAD(P)-dependent dehydrogenase (short-subunit alcohol dehydrogenase family)
MLTRLEGKHVLVTGGGTGIGEGVAKAMTREGCRVVICGRREPQLRSVAESATGPVPVRYRCCDLSRREQVVELRDWLAAEKAEPEIVVNCAGTNIPRRSMAEVDPDEFDRVLAINATGTFNLLHALLPAMRRRRDGLIINIVSVAGRRVFLPAGVPYSASKFAQAAIGSFVNFEVAAEGVRVTNIYPGEVNTPILDQRPVVPSAEQRAQMLQPEDLGDLVVSLARLPGRALVSEVVITPTYMPQG